VRPERIYFRIHQFHWSQPVECKLFGADWPGHRNCFSIPTDKNVCFKDFHKCLLFTRSRYHWKNSIGGRLFGSSAPKMDLAGAKIQ